MSIRRMSLGQGYRYLLSSVARGDGAPFAASGLTRYYAESGTPPGWFLGAGLAGLADGVGVVDRSLVTEEHLFRMLGMLQDPVTGRPLGRAPARVAAAVDGSTRRPVAGFDLTFSVPKSVSVMWALADADTQRAIYDAHISALRFTIAHAEQVVFATRSGKGGVLQEDIRGIVAAAFDHWNSRDGDPQLHTHVAVLNRAQNAAGAWKTLDSRALFKATVTLSALYNGVLSDYLTRALGVGWEPTERGVGKRVQWEIAGVPAALREEFSKRSASIDQAAADLIAHATAAHGRPLSESQRLRLRQQATLMTRPEKQHRSLADLTADWRDRARTHIGDQPEAWARSLRNRNPLPLLAAADLEEGMLRDTASVAAGIVSEGRATFSRANMLAETLRQLNGVRFATPDDRLRVAERVTDHALDQSVLITPPDLAHTPGEFLRPDGTSRFRPGGSELYTSLDLLDAEARLLDAGRDTTAPRAPARTLEQTACASSLTVEQRAAVSAVMSSGRAVDVLVGAAGTGKTTALAALREAWEVRFGPGSVTGMAPSAAAAEVLADCLGIHAENSAKWLTELAQNQNRMNRLDELHAKQNHHSDLVARLRYQRRIDQLTTEIDRWSIRSNQLIILDEASLAATRDLDTLTRHITAAGAKLLLVGDPAQLSAVSAGGAFGMLVRDRAAAPELTTVQRFTEPWERAASLRLRAGDTSVIDTYLNHGRVAGGDRDSMLDALYSAWHTDTANGLDSVMIAADNDTVQALNTRAQAARTDAGEVSEPRLTTDSGYRIGVGDVVVSRRNDRTLHHRAGWVKNGDRWTVTATHQDGSCTVARDDNTTAVRLPARYVRAHVELGYATSAHRAQGRTSDTAHAYITSATSRELLYVAATRGRHTNQLYVDAQHDPDPTTVHGPGEHQAPRDVLQAVLCNDGTDHSATETIRSEWNTAHSIRQLLNEYDTIAAADRRTRYDPLFRTSPGLTPARIEAITTSDSYGALLAALDTAAARGLNIERALPRMNHDLDEAGDPAAVLHHRVDSWTSDTPTSATGRDLILGLFPPVTAATSPDTQRALDERRDLIEARAHEVAATALRTRAAWLATLGQPPTAPKARDEWLRQIMTVAAYRDRWDIHDDTLPGAAPSSSEQAVHRQGAEHAATQMLAQSHTGTRGGNVLHRTPTPDISR